jgi:hypothetical protein
MFRTLREIVGFLRWQWPHLLLAVPGALLVTVLHEASHAAAVAAQGGRLTGFQWLPSGGHWGQVEYAFPAGVSYSIFAISVAPYCLWVLVAGAACALSLRERPCRPWVASASFVWVFVVPLADTANTAFPYLDGAHNDFRSAFGAPSVLAWLLAISTTMACGLVGFVVQRRLYRERAVSHSAYLVLCAMTLAGIAAVSGGWLL